jgi:hypothetical protein
MPTGLSVYLRSFLSDSSLWSTLVHPILVWENGAPSRIDPERDTVEPYPVTLPGGAGPQRPASGEPLVFDVRKGLRAGNALIGVTAGRTPNNDICIDDESVSRFHAVFARDDRTDLWSLVDVGSKNGIKVAGTRLEPQKPRVLEAREELIIGTVPMLFLLPETFRAYAQALMK